MQQPVRFQHIGALPILPPFFAWSIASDGTVLSIAGPAEERFGPNVGRVTGHDYRTVFADEPAVCDLVTRALEGRTLAEMVRAWGVVWFSIVRPSEGGVTGWSLLLPDELAEADVPEPDGLHTWLITEAIRAEGVHWRPGDLVRYDGRHMVHAEEVDPATGLTLLRRHAARVAYLLPTDEPRPVHSPECSGAEAPPRAALHLIR